MEKTYNRINFQNSPTKTTPLSAANLNKMDKAIDELDNRSVDADGKIKELKGRMDAFTSLGEGGTTGDAELTDGRVDYKGDTHTNIGEHIREVSRQFSSEIENKKDNDKTETLTITDGFGWIENRYIDASNGNETYVQDLSVIASKPINIKGYSYIELYMLLEASVGSGGIAFYDKDNNFIKGYGDRHNCSLTETFVEKRFFEIPRNAETFRVTYLKRYLTDYYIKLFPRKNIETFEDVTLSKNAKYVGSMDFTPEKGFFYNSNSNIIIIDNNNDTRKYLVELGIKYNFKAYFLNQNRDCFGITESFYTNTNKYNILNADDINMDKIYIICTTEEPLYGDFKEDGFIISIMNETFYANLRSENGTVLLNSFNVITKDNEYRSMFNYLEKFAFVKTIFTPTYTDDGAWNSKRVGRGICVVKDTVYNVYRMFYDGYNGSYDSIGSAYSTDIENWTNIDNNPVLKPSEDTNAPDYGGTCFPCIVKHNDTWIMFYVGFGTRGFEGYPTAVCYAESTDLINWTKHTTPIITKDTFDAELHITGVYKPEVFYYKGKWHMMINCADTGVGGHEQIYHLETDSGDPRTGWKNGTKVLELPQNSEMTDWGFISDPEIVKIGNVFAMFNYTEKYLTVSFTNEENFPNNWKTYKYDSLPKNANIFRPEIFIDEKGDMYMFANTGTNEVNLSVYKRV